MDATVPIPALASIVIATLYVAALPIVLYWRMRRPLALDRRDAIVGIAVFAFFAMIVERALNGYVLGINETTAAWLAHPVAFVVYGAFVAGICEEVGRYVGMRYMQRRAVAPSTAAAPEGRALAYGLGHGGAEGWLVGVLTQLQWIVFAIFANRGELDAHLQNVPPDALVRIHLLLASLSLPTAALFALERTAALVFQVALSMLMWRGLRAGWRWVLPVAIAAHALIDVPAALFQARLLPLVAVDGLYAIAALVLGVWLARHIARACRGDAVQNRI